MPELHCRKQAICMHSRVTGETELGSLVSQSEGSPRTRLWESQSGSSVPGWT